MRFSVALALLLAAACGGDRSPASPTFPLGQVLTPLPAPTSVSMSGYVIEGEVAGREIAGATIRVVDGPNAGTSATTDGQGHYSLSGLSPATFTVAISAPGYQEKTAQVTLKTSSRADFYLQPTSPL